MTFNVHQQPALFAKLSIGTSLEVEFNTDEVKYNIRYYLVDNPICEKKYESTREKKRKDFAEVQGVQKEVERAVCVLLDGFAIVRGPARFWQQESL